MRIFCTALTNSALNRSLKLCACPFLRHPLAHCPPPPHTKEAGRLLKPAHAYVSHRLPHPPNPRTAVGRMDQACAYGCVPVLMTFDADVLHINTIKLKGKCTFACLGIRLN